MLGVLHDLGDNGGLQGESSVVVTAKGLQLQHDYKHGSRAIRQREDVESYSM